MPWSGDTQTTAGRYSVPRKFQALRRRSLPIDVGSIFHQSSRVAASSFPAGPRAPSDTWQT